jgi:hemolysin type calcium-binding protein
MRARTLIGTIVLSLLAVGLVLASSKNPSAGAISTRNCTAIGTAGRDIMTGGKGRQIICTKGSGDYAHGQDGNDVLRGGSKNDTLIGGNGADHIVGKEGPDQLFAVDGIRGNDVVKGGKGNDHCYADVGDKLQGCEIVHRGATMPESQSLQSKFGGVMVLAEEQIAEGSPSPVPGPTLTQTQTITITATSCPPGPPQPPPFCGSSTSGP